MRFVLKAGEPGIIITDEALSFMIRYRQLSATAKEAGGQLFATFDGVDTVIVEATTPKALDKRSRYGFTPNRLVQQREILDRHKKGLHFVGDWHSHPEGIPRPSEKDIDDMVECFRLSTHKLRAFIMVIIGTHPGPHGLYAALIDERGATALRFETALPSSGLL